MAKELLNVNEYKRITPKSRLQIVTEIGYIYEGTVSVIGKDENTLSVENAKFVGTDPNLISKNEEAAIQLPENGFRIKNVTFWLDKVNKIYLLQEGHGLCDSAVKTAVGIEKPTSPSKAVTANRSSTTESVNTAHEGSGDRRSNRRSVQSTGNARRGRATDSQQPALILSVPRNRYSVPIRDTPYEGNYNRRINPNNMTGRGAYSRPTRNGGPQNGGRRRNYGRRGGPRVTFGPQNESVDTEKPYDFETHNAEIEAVLSRINLGADGVEGQDSPSAGDRQAGESGVGLAGKASDSGASGDSSKGITSNESEHTGITEGQVLSRGEYYVKEKSFFDQISRSEGGPRGPSVGSKGGRSGFNNDNNRGFNRSGNTSSISNIRRERQLNIETFGASAARSLYNPRRRHTGSVSRDLLVSAPA